MWGHPKTRFGAWILGALFALLIIEMVLFSPEVLDPVKQDPLVPVTESQAETAAQVMVGINVVEIRDQHKDWELWSEKALSRRGEGDLELEKVRIRFFGPEGIEYLVTGDRGSVEQGTKNMQVLGQVVMESSNGYQFRTANLTYTSDSRILNTTAHVAVLGPPEPQGGRLKLDGTGLQASLIGETMQVLGGVYASKKIHQRGGSMMTIRSENAVMSARDKEITFQDRVQMEHEQVKVKAPSAKFLYDDAGRELKAIELSGGVRVADHEKWATSESVRLDLDRHQYVFRGRPRVVQDADELFGDEITFLDGGKNVRIKNARVKVSRERIEGVN